MQGGFKTKKLLPIVYFCIILSFVYSVSALSLLDDFNDNTINNTLWSTQQYDNGGCGANCSWTVEETGGYFHAKAEDDSRFGAALITFTPKIDFFGTNNIFKVDFQVKNNGTCYNGPLFYYPKLKLSIYSDYNCSDPANNETCGTWSPSANNSIMLYNLSMVNTTLDLSYRLEFNSSDKVRIFSSGVFDKEVDMSGIIANKRYLKWYMYVDNDLCGQPFYSELSVDNTWLDRDQDGDGFNSTVDCDDNNASVHPPSDGMIINTSTTFCPGTYDLPNRITIDNDNITLDCNGAVLVGNNDLAYNFSNFGILLNQRSGVTVKNCNVTNYYMAIKLISSENNKIISNNVQNNNFGIWAYNYSLTNEISSNNAFNNIGGIFASKNSSGNVIYNNYAFNNSVGIQLSYSPYQNTVSNNTVSNNQDGIMLTDDIANALVLNNNINSNNNTGIHIQLYSSNNMISNNNIYSNRKGIQFYAPSPNNIIQYNNIVNSTDYSLYNSYDTQLDNTTATYNYWGTTNCIEISEKIFDYYDNESSGIINYVPVLDALYPDGLPINCSVDTDGDGYESIIDCNDTNSSIYPGAPELCNGVDDDCDGVIDEGCIISYWNFNENLGTLAADSSINENNGTVNGATWTLGVDGSALSFDGVDDYVSVPDSSTLDLGTGNFTISIWVKLNTPTIEEVIFDKDLVGTPSGMIRMSTSNNHDGRIMFGTNSAGGGNSVIYSTTSLNASEWYHIVVVRNNIDYTIWVNGALDNSAPENTVGSLDNDQPLIIGGRNDFQPASFFNGTIDEFKIYNYALTEAGILVEYNAVCFPNWYVQYGSCLTNDSKLKYYADNNTCGTILDLPVDNGTYVACNYCSYSVTNTSWTEWQNQGSCLTNDSQFQNQSKTEYDNNYNSCYAVTSLASDLWNSGNNNTYWNYQYAVCDYCIPSWHEINESCQADDAIMGWYNDTNYCFTQTGLSSDNNPPPNSSYSCDYCTPDWDCNGYGACNTSDEQSCNSAADLNSCFATTGLPNDQYSGDYSEFIPQSCDYCNPLWYETNTTCLMDDSIMGYYTDTNNCYVQTGLSSDNNTPVNNTYTCDYCTINLMWVNTTCQLDDKIYEYAVDNNDCLNITGLDSDKLPANNTYTCDYCIPNWVCNDHNESGYCNSILDLNDCYIITGLISDTYSGDYSEFPIATFNDSIIGNESSINSTDDIDVIIGNNSLDNWTSMTSTLDIRFELGNKVLAEFSYNFSDKVLNLTNITVEKENGNGAVKGYILVSGIQQEETKTLYLHNISPNFNWVCIKDADTSNISEITPNCQGTNEYHVQCNNQSTSGYRCEDLSNDVYRITGLQHSAVIQADAPAGGDPPGGGGGGGGGGFTPSCTESWSCTAWTGCSQAGTQIRRCTDENGCGTENSKPDVESSCTYIPPEPREVKENVEEEETVTATQVESGEEEQKPTGFAGITGAVIGNALMSKAGIISARIILILMVAGIASTIILRKKNIKSKKKKNR